MARRFWACGMLLLALTAGVYADGKPATVAPHAGLERMKKLAGTCSRRSTSRIAGVKRGSGPSSKVMATHLSRAQSMSRAGRDKFSAREMRAALARILPVPALAPKVQLFMAFYWSMTGLHALHMIIGAGLLIWMMLRAWRGDFGPEYYGPVEIMGLYWHFVDIVWVFLYPLLYLIDVHK